ncbi:MAG: MAPEG family protein [Alphaproteobacteria bacterium]|nr:MAG: MAPEG family protein [Alphaproteobacteria bacterium]
MDSPIIAPVVALVAWSLVVMIWMVVTRMPAMKKAGINLKGLKGGRPGALDGVLQEQVQWKAHNYNHLMEQPTLFYAITLSLALLGAGGGFNLYLAWAYVVLRVLHSLVQGTINLIAYRFALFALSSLALIALTLHAAMALLHHHM